MKQRLPWYFFLLMILGCDQVTLHDSGSNQTQSEAENGVHTPSPNSDNVPIFVGTHLIGKDSFDDFTPLPDGGNLPIVYGHQGAYMVILSLQLPQWSDEKISISISAHYEEDIVASLFYPDLVVERTSEVVFINNLFMLTNNWEEYMDQPLWVEIHCSGQQTESHTDLVLHFTPPQKSFF